MCATARWGGVNDDADIPDDRDPRSSNRNEDDTTHARRPRATALTATVLTDRHADRTSFKLHIACARPCHCTGTTLPDHHSVVACTTLEAELTSTNRRCAAPPSSKKGFRRLGMSARSVSGGLPKSAQSFSCGTRMNGSVRYDLPSASKATVTTPRNSSPLIHSGSAPVSPGKMK